MDFDLSTMLGIAAMMNFNESFTLTHSSTMTRTQRGMLLLLVIIIVTTATAQTYAAEIKPFTSDGCSAFPDGTPEQNTLWLNCCVLHDFAYWQGGTYQQRQEADLQLRQCVKKVGEPEIAALMLAGVRVGGTPFFPTSFRWGYGWPYPRFYGELTQEELKEIRRVIDISQIQILP